MQRNGYHFKYTTNKRRIEVKLKLLQLVLSSETLRNLSQERMSGSLSFRFGRNLDKIVPELTAYDKKRQELLERYGTLSEDKTQYRFKDEEALKYQTELDELLGTELNLNLHILTVADVQSFPSKPSDLRMIEWMIVQEEVVKPPDAPEKKDKQND